LEIRKIILIFVTKKKQPTNQQTKESMKRFSLRGNTANWGALKVKALNTATEENELCSVIPAGMKMSVRVVNNYYRVYDKNVRQILHGEISATDTEEILNRLTQSKRPDFILFHEGRVIGFANLHHRHRLKKYTATATITTEMPIEVKARTTEEALAAIKKEAELALAESGFIGESTIDGVFISKVERL
jgi:hypothetical protein